MKKKYNYQKIEKKWQKVWEQKGLYRAKDFSKKPKYYALVEFPYPSGDGLHVGHLRQNIALDIIARKRRMQGYNVMYPMGWDAFGLPTENYAVKTGINPKIVTKRNSDNFRRQLKMMGFSFDWSREINTTDPKYYKWTQWLFLQFFKEGLAYKTKMPINWCPSCKIGLANEEVVAGKCERCGHVVEQKEREQWMLKITAYADKLLEGLKEVDYLSEIKLQQTNWIGKSIGAKINFQLKGNESSIAVFTTRPDTLCGATYLVLAPEHPYVALLKLQIKNWDDVQSYIQSASKRNEIERTAEGKEKTGVELKGVIAVNPATQKEIPVWIADYVMPHYGTGAIMAVPAHDERDFKFAKKFGLPAQEVVVEQINKRAVDGVFRRIAISIIENKKGEILIQSDTVNGKTSYCLPGGGVDEGESEEQAAIREAVEETGYVNFIDIHRIGTVEANYFNAKRKVNRQALATCFAMKVKDYSKTKLTLTKLEKQGHIQNEWVNKQKAVELLSGKDASSGEDCPLFKRYLNISSRLYTGSGILINSSQFDGLSSEEMKWKITELVGGKKQVRYKLRDWIFSRQRYWGEPIPLIYCSKCGYVPVPEKELPLKLPNIKDFKPRPDGQSPLATLSSWVNVRCPKCKGSAKRETDVMPNWAGSSWYFLRYTDPNNTKKFADPKKLKYWTPVDWYSGGMEHTTLHLLYSRFWNQFLFDYGLVPTSEPYKKRTKVGLILAEGGAKMSKSKGNVINPDIVVKHYGADVLRTYEMFMGPFDQMIPWDSNGIGGVRRFLEKAWVISQQKKFVRSGKSLQLEKILHKTIKKVSEDTEAMAFNTAVSSLMVFVNECYRAEEIPVGIWKTFLLLLAPFAPHTTEELWEQFSGKGKSIHTAPWPEFDPKLIKETTSTVVIQVNGKVRDKIEVAADMKEEQVKTQALATSKLKAILNGRSPKKVIYVPGRIINIILP